MAKVLMTDPTTGRLAIYEEAPGGGDVTDPNSNRNRPLNSPADWLDLVQFHSDFDYYQVAVGPTNVTVNHASVAGQTTDIDLPSGFAIIERSGQIVSTHIDLLTHGLGYVPRYMVISGNTIIAPSTTIQIQTNRDRRVTPYATTTKIRLLDIGTSSSSALSAMSKDYTVLVFRQPAVENDYLFDFDPSDGGVILGCGKFNSRNKMLRNAGAGDSAFDISLGRTVDITNGSARTVLADGTTTSETYYDGAFTGSPSADCAVE